MKKKQKIFFLNLKIEKENKERQTHVHLHGFEHINNIISTSLRTPPWEKKAFCASQWGLLY